MQVVATTVVDGHGNAALAAATKTHQEISHGVFVHGHRLRGLRSEGLLFFISGGKGVGEWSRGQQHVFIET